MGPPWVLVWLGEAPEVVFDKLFALFGGDGVAARGVVSAGGEEKWEKKEKWEEDRGQGRVVARPAGAPGGDGWG